MTHQTQIGRNLLHCQMLLESSLLTLPTPNGFFHANWGSELGKQRSITGCVFTFSGLTIAFKSKIQMTTASSSTEAEFIAVFFTAAEAARCSRFVLQELGHPQDDPTEIHTDGQAGLQTINGNEALTVCVRRQDVWLFSLHDWQEEESVSVVHVAGVLNPLDDLTKLLALCLHVRHCQRMMGHFNQFISQTIPSCPSD